MVIHSVFLWLHGCCLFLKLCLFLRMSKVAELKEEAIRNLCLIETNNEQYLEFLGTYPACKVTAAHMWSVQSVGTIAANWTVNSLTLLDLVYPQKQNHPADVFDLFHSHTESEFHKAPKHVFGSIQVCRNTFPFIEGPRICERVWYLRRHHRATSRETGADDETTCQSNPQIMLTPVVFGTPVYDGI